MTGRQLRVDWPKCLAHGLCAEVLAEMVHLDEWRYPVVDRAPVPDELLDHARRAVAACPTLALRLIDLR